MKTMFHFVKPFRQSHSAACILCLVRRKNQEIVLSEHENSKDQINFEASYFSSLKKHLTNNSEPHKCSEANS